MKIKDNICENIFRGYDIRGVYPKELDEDTVYTIGLGFGTHIKRLGKTTCIIGHDNRLSSPSLYESLKQGILETGINVIGLGLCTTPMYYYACIKLEVYSGVMVTASHNPKDDNGLKFAFDESGNCKGQEIQDFLAFIKTHDFDKGEGAFSTYNIKNDYFELFKNSLSFGSRRIKVVIDPGNGTTSIIAKELYSMFPIDVISINDESDGSFPNHHPDPCVEDNLHQLKQKAQETGADLGIGFDGDGDRLGVISNSSKFIPTSHYMIIIIRDLINKVSNKTFLYDVKCSKAVDDEIKKLGATAICSRTGHAYTKAKVKEENLPFGAEYSGHVYFRDKFLGFDSGLYAGLRLIEILSHSNKSIDQLLEGINKYFTTGEIKIKSPDDLKFSVVEKVTNYVKGKGYNYVTIDGVKVLFEDGWALIRASNTGPHITVVFESKTEERLREIQKEFIDIIEKNNIELI